MVFEVFSNLNDSMILCFIWKECELFCKSL